MAGKTVGDELEDLSPEALLERAYALQDEAEARALYRDWAASYDRTMLDGLGYLTPKRTAALLASRNGERGLPVLDVGCGTGLAGLELAGHGYRVIDGLDYSPEMLAVARSRGIYRDLHEADLNAPLPIGDATYAAMISTGTFTHAHVGAQCLDELFRLLAPGGLFACTVHKDVWEPAGFAAQTRRLEAAGILTTLSMEPGTYYSTSSEPEGHYILWRRN